MILVLVRSVKSILFQVRPLVRGKDWNCLSLWSSFAIHWVIRFPIFWDVPTGFVSHPPQCKEAGCIWCQISFNPAQSPLYDITAHHHGNVSRVTETGLWHHSIRQEEGEGRGEERIETARRDEIPKKQLGSAGM